VISLFTMILALAAQGDTTSTDSAPDNSPLLLASKANDSINALDSSWVDISAIPNAPKTIDMSDRVGEYFLYWNTVYTLHIANDGVSVIEPPPGFLFESAVIGNGKLFAIQQTKNRITLKKLAFDNVSTNLVLVVLAPNGETHSVAIDVKGGKNTTQVARFIVPVDRETNATIDKVRASYISQMNLRLQGQETVLNKSIWASTLMDQQVFRIPQNLIETEDSWKGATFRLDAVVNSRDEGIVYMSSDANDRECQVVDLLSINSLDGIVKKRVQLIGKRRINNKWTQYIYSTGRMEPGKWYFNIAIWSREFKIKAELELTGKGVNE
jgi:hypothetical protein